MSSFLPAFSFSLPLRHHAHSLSRRPNCPHAKSHPTLPRRRHVSRCTAVSDFNSRHANPRSTSNSDQTWRRNNAALVSAAERSGLDSAIALLQNLCQNGSVATQNFNQVVSLLAHNGRFEDGMELADQAGRRGLANIITFRPLMKRCCAEGDGRGAKKVWKIMTKYGIDGDMFLYAELTGALVRSQDMLAAEKIVTTLLDSGRRPHIVLYNTLLKGYAKQANVKKAFHTLQVIDETGVRPDETTFNTLLNTCVRARDENSLKRAIDLMHQCEVKPGAPTYNTLLKMYSRNGDFGDALAIFEEMKSTVDPSIVTYNTLIDGCAHRGNIDAAVEFFDEMIERGFTPDICTMTSLLKGFGRANKPERAVELYEAMKEGGFKIEPRTQYAVINACLRANDRINAMNIIQEMKESGIRVRNQTWIWMLECAIWADDDKGALEALRLMYRNGAALDSSSKSTMLREVRDRGGFLRLEPELKSAKTVEGHANNR